MGRKEFKALLWNLGAINQASWLFPEGLEFSDKHVKGGSGPEDTELIPSSIQNFGMRSDSSGPEQYILCMYVVLCSIREEAFQDLLRQPISLKWCIQ
jgi:hypothetical protein